MIGKLPLVMPGLAALVLFGTLQCAARPEPAAEKPQAGAAQVDQPGAMMTSQAEAPPAGAAPGAHPALMPAHGGGSADLTWSVPEGWAAETPSSAMRRAQYRIPAAAGDAEAGECVVFYFGPGQGGDISSNVARWASQFKGTNGAAVTPKVTETSSGDRTVTHVELRGTYESGMGMNAPHGGGAPKSGSMLLGAIVPGGDANWFFKCTGAQKTIEANRARFDQMIASVH